MGLQSKWILVHNAYKSSKKENDDQLIENIRGDVIQQEIIELNIKEKQQLLSFNLWRK